MTVPQWLFQNEIISRHKSEEVTNNMYQEMGLVESIASVIDGLIPVMITGSKEQIDARLDMYNDIKKKRLEQNKKIISYISGEDWQDEAGEEVEKESAKEVEEPIKKSKVIDDNIDYSDPEAVKAYMKEVYDPIPSVISVPKSVLAEREFVVDTFRRDELKEELRFQKNENKDTPGGGKFVLRKRGTLGSKPKTGKAGIFLEEEGNEDE